MEALTESKRTNTPTNNTKGWLKRWRDVVGGKVKVNKLPPSRAQELVEEVKT